MMWGAAAGGVHQEVILSQPGSDSVVDDHAVLVEHQAVATPAYWDLQEGIGVDTIQEEVGIGSLDVDLSKS